MVEESPIVPLAPTRKHHPRSDEEYGHVKRKELSQGKSSKCLVYVLVSIVTLGALLLVLASVFLRASTPVVGIRSVTVQNLRQGNATSPSFNVTLVAELTIENENVGFFDFENCSGSISYGGVKVGDMKIRDGRVGARVTKMMNVTVELGSNGYLDSDENLRSDINSGMLKLNSYAKLNGRLNLLNIRKKTMTLELKCSMTLVLRSQVIEDLFCS